MATFLHIIDASRLLKKLRDDPKEEFRAASDAQRIADYLLAYHPAYAAKDDGLQEVAPADPSVKEAA